ncbi:hypothetical protein STEG23_017815, partial [Scotinomys teguina]
GSSIYELSCGSVYKTAETQTRKKNLSMNQRRVSVDVVTLQILLRKLLITSQKITEKYDFQ